MPEDVHNQPETKSRIFRKTLPQYDHDPENLFPVIYGIMRRLLWLLKHFGIV